MVCCNRNNNNFLLSCNFDQSQGNFTHSSGEIFPIFTIFEKQKLKTRHWDLILQESNITATEHGFFFTSKLNTFQPETSFLTMPPLWIIYLVQCPPTCYLCPDFTITSSTQLSIESIYCGYSEFSSSTQTIIILDYPVCAQVLSQGQ